jgi:hypothetical protein
MNKAAAKKPAPAKVAEKTQCLVNAIVTVKQLQNFIQGHGGLENALNQVARVEELVKMTGGFEELKDAVSIVGKPDAPQG